jgi:hypothetical protein
MGLGSEIRGPEKNLFLIPDPGVKKAPDPGSATLLASRCVTNLATHLPMYVFAFNI